MSQLALDLLQNLVRLPSVNPQFFEKIESEITGESRITEFLTQYCSESGWKTLRQWVHPGRDNFVALIPGCEAPTKGASADNLPTLLFEAHQDTVAVAGMTIEPFAGDIRQGRLWGRGACDIKGGMAAMLAALTRVSAVSAEESAPRPHVLFAATINEECGFSGIRKLAALWDQSPTGEGSGDLDQCDNQFDGDLTLDELLEHRPQAAIVSEPTDLNVVVAHRGVARWRVHCHGRAAHSSNPRLGVNAVYGMAEIVRAIRKFNDEELANRPADPRCGRSTVAVTTIAGGVGANTIPELATIDVDRRLSPGEQPELAYQELVAWIAEQADLNDCRVEHELPWMKSFGLAEDDNRELAEAVGAVAKSIAPDRGQLQGVPYGANAATLAAVGIPTVVFGPGSIEQAHTVDEWIDLDELDRAEEAYYQLAKRGFGFVGRNE